MKQRHGRKKNFTRSKQIICNVCGKTFLSQLHFKRHLNEHSLCKNSHKELQCITCGFIGNNKTALDKHMFYNPTCKHYHKQRIVTTGLLPDAALPVITTNESNNDISSFIIPRYSTDGHIDNVQSHVKDSTMKSREKNNHYHLW